jgi:hypothetical protein
VSKRSKIKLSWFALRQVLISQRALIVPFLSFCCWDNGVDDISELILEKKMLI